MLSAEKQCSLVPLCLQDCCLGSLEEASDKAARASFSCTMLLPSMLWEWQPRQGDAQNTEVPGTSGLCILEMCCLDRETRWPALARAMHFAAGSSTLAQRARLRVRPLARRAATVTFCSVIQQDSGIWQHSLPVPVSLLFPLPGCTWEGGIWGNSLKPELLRPEGINKRLKGVRDMRQGSPHLQEPERLLCTGGHNKERGGKTGYKSWRKVCRALPGLSSICSPEAPCVPPGHLSETLM